MKKVLIISNNSGVPPAPPVPTKVGSDLETTLAHLLDASGGGAAAGGLEMMEAERLGSGKFVG